MYQDCVFIPLHKPINGGLASVRRAVVRDPEDAPRRSIGFLFHHQIDQPAERRDAGFRLAESENLRPPDVPRSQVCYCAAAFVFVFHAARIPGNRRRYRNHVLTRLNAGFLVGAYHIVVGTEGFTFPCSVIEVKNATSLFFKVGVTRPNPTPVTPRPDGIGMQPTPNRRTADRSDYASLDGFFSDLFATQSRERQAQVFGKLARQRFDFHHNLRGEKWAGARALVVPRDQPDVLRRSVFATWRRSGAA